MQVEQTIKKYDNYKDSGIEWIGEIPQGWEVTSLKRLTQILTCGYAATPQYYDEGVPFLSAQNVKNGKLDLKKFNRISKELHSELTKYKKPQKGDILQVRVGATIGQTCIIDCDLDFSIYVSLTHIRANQLMNNNYLSIILGSSSFINEALNKTYQGGGVGNLNVQDLRNIYCPIPKISEQIKIAEYLDKKCGAIDEVIEMEKLVIEKLKEYKQSIITEAVTKGLDKSAPLKDSGIEWIGKIPQEWEVRKLKTIGDYRNGLTYSPEDMCEEEQGTLVLRSSNIKQGKLVLTDNVYVSVDIPKTLKVQKGDILVCSRNGSRDLIGKNAIIDSDINASFGAFMMILRCSCPKYMYYILNSHIFNYYLGSFFTSTINQLTGKNFGGMDIVFCSNKVEQERIVNYLDKKCSEIDKAIADKEKVVEKFTEYKKSLIYECVTGKRKVV